MFLGVLSLVLAVVNAGWVLIAARRQVPAISEAPAQVQTNLSKYLIPRWFFMSSQLTYGLTLALGLYLLVMLPIKPYWIVAKLVLFVVMVSSVIKASRTQLTPKERVTGLVIADVAWIGIVALIATQPPGFFGG